jgi:uncharacterized protein
MNGPSSPAREKSFSCTCNQCGCCCKEKIIRVNPYEVARLALFLRIGTSQFLKTYTWAGGTILRMPYKGHCVFRNTQGCAVHKARPLVCRLYPLRRNTSEDGTEHFDLLDFEPGCIALASNQGTVAGYLSEQNAMEHLGVSDGYIGLTDTIADTLKREIGEDSSLAREAALRCIAPSIYDPGPVPEWLDMDPVVSEYCLQTGLTPPKDVEEKARVHIEAVRAWLAGPAGANRDHPSTHLKRDDRDQSVFPRRLTRVKTLARTLAVLGYSIGANLEELSQELFGTPDSREEETEG